jgi:hypothetical protein
MSKNSAKGGIILIGGYAFSSYVMSYEAQAAVDAVEVTGMNEGSHNFIPGQKIARVSCNMLWDVAANQVHTALSALPSAKHVMIIPDGFTLGNPSLSMPFMEANYTPAGSPDSAIGVGSIEFQSYGDNDGLEFGWALAHATVTETTTGTGYDDPTGAQVTAECSGTLHVWTPVTNDSYAVVIQDSANGSDWADLVTFTLDGTARNSERVTVASGAIDRYRRVVATCTGANEDPFGYSVHFWHG